MSPGGRHLHTDRQREREREDGRVMFLKYCVEHRRLDSTSENQAFFFFRRDTESYYSATLRRSGM